MNRKGICGKFGFLFCVGVVCFGAMACKQQKKTEPYKNQNTPVKEFLFSITEYNINGTSDVLFPEIYYVSNNVLRFLNTHFLDKGRIFTVAEIYFPYNKGFLESHGYYDPSSDTGDWVEDCLVAYEEAKIAAVFEESMEIEPPTYYIEGLEDFDDSLDFLNDYVESDGHVDLSEEVIVENDFGDDSGSEEGEVTSPKESVEKRLLDSNYRLRMLTFEEEIFIPEARTGEQVLISADGKKVRRSFYDDKYRLVKREYWNIVGLRDSKVTKMEEYGYNSSNLAPTEKSITTDDTTIKTYFNSDGTAFKSETYKYAVVKTEEKNKKSSKTETNNSESKSEKNTESKVKYLKSSVEWKYNADGKITSEATATYEYKNDNYSKPSKIYRQRQVYSYHDDEEIPPDYEYFENGKLRMRTVYTSTAQYRTDTIFESNFSVSTFYEESRKVREVFYQNGKRIRTRNYE